MGLFVLRKADHPSFTVNENECPNSGAPEKSVARFIRSRFSGRKSFLVKLGSSSSSSHAPITPFSNSPLYSDVPEHESSELPRRSTQVGGRGILSSDVVTMTLAQRLNELATAHSEGLLSDDDYRVLRQNLFNSLAPHSAAPVETPVVKSVEPVSLLISPTSRSECSAVNSVCASSVITYTTSGSSVSTLFQRLWKRSREHGSLDVHDGESALSSPFRKPLSSVVNPNARELGRQLSSTSLRTARSRQVHTDLRSVSSRRSMRSVTTSEKDGMSRGSTRSLRNDPPPSSFNPKSVSSRLMASDGNGDRLRSAADIRAEIIATEAELQTVLSTFFTMTKAQCDVVSVGRLQDISHYTESPGPGLFGRYKRSASEPCQSDVHQVLNKRSIQSQDLSTPRSHNGRRGVMAKVGTDELEQRRAEVKLRYQQRLDYLRARLKGAEIHERLLRK